MKNSNLEKSTSLVDSLVKKIRSNIYTGRYPAGKKLVIRELSEEFNVSHTPVQDALNRLVSEGYVLALPRRSMIVRTYTNAEIIDALTARLMCEIFCSPFIIDAVQKSPETIDEMRTILSNMKNLIDNFDHIEYENWVINETNFHRAYMKYCGNPQIFKFYQQLDTNRTTYFAYLDNAHMPLKQSILENNLLEHTAITDALQALDTQKLINAIIRHISRACTDYATDEECIKKCHQLEQIRDRFET